MFIVIRT